MIVFIYAITGTYQEKLFDLVYIVDWQHIYRVKLHTAN